MCIRQASRWRFETRPENWSQSPSSKPRQPLSSSSCEGLEEVCGSRSKGTSAAWLYDLLKPHVTKVIVCNPRKNALLNAGSKSDRVDAQKLSDLLRAGMLTPVYHGENGVRTLRELGRSYITVTKDLTRVMNRVKALYR